MRRDKSFPMENTMLGFSKSNTAGIRAQLLRVRDGITDDKLVAEASSAETSPERLTELANSQDPFVRLAVAKNQSTPKDAIYDLLLA